MPPLSALQTDELRSQRNRSLFQMPIRQFSLTRAYSPLCFSVCLYVCLTDCLSVLSSVCLCSPHLTSAAYRWRCMRSRIRQPDKYQLSSSCDVSENPLQRKQRRICVRFLSIIANVRYGLKIRKWWRNSKICRLNREFLIIC